MIQANELRIGNWVINDCDDSCIKLSAQDILTASNDENWLEPIPLTSEILEQCGFHNEDKELGAAYWKLKHRFCKNAWSDKFTFYLPYKNLSTYTGDIEVEYLHQLQNLYFALTGAELQINLNVAATN